MLDIFVGPKIKYLQKRMIHDLVFLFDSQCICGVKNKCLLCIDVLYIINIIVLIEKYIIMLPIIFAL